MDPSKLAPHVVEGSIQTGTIVTASVGTQTLLSWALGLWGFGSVCPDHSPSAHLMPTTDFHGLSLGTLRLELEPGSHLVQLVVAWRWMFVPDYSSHRRGPTSGIVAGRSTGQHPLPLTHGLCELRSLKGVGCDNVTVGRVGSLAVTCAQSLAQVLVSGFLAFSFDCSFLLAVSVCLKSGL